MALEVVIGVLAFLLCALVVAVRTGALRPRHRRALAVAYLWVTTHAFPRFWRWADPRLVRAVRRYGEWWDRDPAEQRGE